MNEAANQTKNHKTRWLRAAIVTIVGVAFAVAIVLYGNRVVDLVLASQFTPSTQVRQVHDSLKLTSQGSTLLYASQPAIQTGAQFNSSCQTTERTAAILGCYTTRKIYLYQVTNTELAGAEEVTAAHEMLHAAYERLNYFERASVDAMITAEYGKLKNNTEIQELVQYYQKAEPDELNNELHSILGTIIVSLSPELENYYSQYFTDRQLVVRLNQKYQSVFDSAEARAKELTGKINAMKPQITAQMATYQADLARLDTDISAFNAQANAGYYKTQSSFNTARQALVSRASELNARRATINTDVATYNAMVSELNGLSVKVDELNSSINAAPAPSEGL